MTDIETAATSPGRLLLRELADVPDVFAGLAPDADLMAAGLSSGELIRLALAVEDRTGTALDDDDLVTLYTIAGIDAVLASATAAG